MGAIEAGHHDVVVYLLKNLRAYNELLEVDSEKVIYENTLLLLQAVQINRISLIVKELLTRGVNINARPFDYNNDYWQENLSKLALFPHGSTNNPEILKMLLDAKMEINPPDKSPCLTAFLNTWRYTKQTMKL